MLTKFDDDLIAFVFRILELQKERYFESLLAKFWNSSARGDCPNIDDSEGITLQSLGKPSKQKGVGLANCLNVDHTRVSLCSLSVSLVNKEV